MPFYVSVFVLMAAFFYFVTTFLFSEFPAGRTSAVKKND